MCWATWPGMPVGIEIPGNQNAEPFAALELELPTNAGMPKETDGVAVAMPRQCRSKSGCISVSLQPRLDSY